MAKERVWDEKELSEFISTEKTIDFTALLKDVKEKLNAKEDFKMANKKLEGLNNTNLLIFNSTDKYFIRIESKGSGHDFARPERGFKILKLFQENNIDIGPKVYYMDASKKIIPYTFMVMEYIEGKVEPKVDIKLAAKCLKKLHSIKLSDLKGDVSVFDIKEKLVLSDEKLIPVFHEIIETWVLKTAKEVLEEEEAMKMEKLYHQVMKEVKDYLPMRKKFKRNYIVHKDAHDLNFILKNNGELILVDWETCHLNHFTVDLATYFTFMTIEEEKYFLKEYGFEETEENKMALWLECLEYLTGALGFYINAYKVTKDSGMVLPNIGDASSIKKKLYQIYDKLLYKVNHKFY